MFILSKIVTLTSTGTIAKLLGPDLELGSLSISRLIYQKSPRGFDRLASLAEYAKAAEAKFSLRTHMDSVRASPLTVPTADPDSHG